MPMTFDFPVREAAEAVPSCRFEVNLGNRHVFLISRGDEVNAVEITFDEFEHFLAVAAHVGRFIKE